MSAPNITQADVEAQITHTFYANLGEAENANWPDRSARDEFHPALKMITTCALITKNGHSVVGLAYCADPAKFNAQTGRDAARVDAIRQLWPMVVYAERERLAAPPQVLSPSLNLTPEKLAELREAMRNAPPMPIISTEPSGIPWTVIVDGDSSTLPQSAGDYLVTVETDSGRETHVLAHTAYGEWMHEGEFTFQHGYYFQPIAWAPRPAGYDGVVPA